MTSIKELFRDYKSFLDKEITVAAWVRTERASKGVIFIELNDGSFLKNLQLVAEESLANFAELEKVGVGSSIVVTGKLVESPAAGQDFELKATGVEIVQIAPEDFPLQKKRHSFEFLREIAHLRPRSNTFSAVFRLRSVLTFAIHKFFQEKGFINVHTPIISSSDCEGAGEMFTVTSLDMLNVPKTPAGAVDFSQDFFGTQTGLTVSGQLQAEAFAMAFKNVYTFGPTFRAENSNTTRHACEFQMVEPEIAFATLTEDMALAEEMVKYVIKYVLEALPEEMEFFNKFIDEGLLARLDKVLNTPFKSLTYTEAIDILLKADKKFEYPVSWGIDLQTEHERYLCEEVVGGPVFVIDYPAALKAFYMRLNDDKKTVAAMDLLVPGIGELLGGSQREDRLEVLEEKMKTVGINPEELSWYLDLRKMGGVPHAGFGLGFERLIMYLSGMANIRDVLPFPRTPKNASF